MLLYEMLNATNRSGPLGARMWLYEMLNTRARSGLRGARMWLIARHTLPIFAGVNGPRPGMNMMNCPSYITVIHLSMYAQKLLVMIKHPPNHCIFGEELL